MDSKTAKPVGEFITGQLVGQDGTHEALISRSGRLVKVSMVSEDGALGTNRVAYGINYEEMRTLLGRLLTLTDATFTDPAQRKAQKDVIRREVGQWMDDVIRDAEHEAFGLDGSPSTEHIFGAIPSDPREEPH